MAEMSSYRSDDLQKDTLFAWDAEDLVVFQYRPKRHGQNNDTTKLILDFKENNREALRVAWPFIERAVGKHESFLRDECKCRYIVSIPPHRAHLINRPGEWVCRRLASRFAWLEHLSGALERTESVRKAAWAPPGERPTAEDHLRTIRYAGKTIPSGMALLMFDDVITRKATSSACREVLKATTGASVVKGIFLGRTTW
jgi:predicted amidophosphoribosyltransferase